MISGSAKMASLKISRENPCRQVVGGYDFISLTQEKIGECPPELFEKLNIKLDEAVARDGRKPIFLVTHYPPWQTMNASSGRSGQKNIRELLNNYPQVISLSGHSHVPLNWERAFWQGEFTAMTTATLSYGCVSGNFFNVAGGCILPFAREVQQARVIDIFDDRVEIHRYNVHDKKEIKPDYLWVVDVPYDREAAKKAAAKRYADAVAPEFPADAKLLIRHDFGFAYLLFPAALSPAPFSFSPCVHLLPLASVQRCSQLFPFLPLERSRAAFILLPRHAWGHMETPPSCDCFHTFLGFKEYQLRTAD